MCKISKWLYNCAVVKSFSSSVLALQNCTLNYKALKLETFEENLCKSTI